MLLRYQLSFMQELLQAVNILIEEGSVWTESEQVI